MKAKTIKVRRMKNNFKSIIKVTYKVGSVYGVENIQCQGVDVTTCTIVNWLGH